MRRRIISIISLVTTIMLCISLSSCALMDALLDSGTTGGNNSLPNGNITVEGGDSYDVTINNPEANINVLAASKGLLSAVSIVCVHDVYQYGVGGIATTSKAYFSGAGVIYKLDKNRGEAYIITNYHVVYEGTSTSPNQISQDITVYLYGQESSDYGIKATYIGGSMNYDLAVLKVENSKVLMESNAQAVSVSDSDKLNLLDTAIAIGNPEGAGLSATVGYINVDSEYITLSMNTPQGTKDINLRVMRIDAAVNSGNSGGGLFNDTGELIGIVNAKSGDTKVDNIGYAIPSNVVRAVADNIIHYCDKTNKESVYRVLLGVTVTPSKQYTVYDPETGTLEKREEVSVSEVSQSGGVAGLLQGGDIINSITIDGVTHEVYRLHHVVDSMLDARVGSSVVMNITRNGTAMDVTVEITDKMLTAY